MKLTIKSKIVGGFLMLALLIATIGYFNFTNIQRIEASYSSLHDYHGPVFDSLNTMKAGALGVSSSVLKFDFLKNEIEQTAQTEEKLTRERVLIAEGKGKFMDAFEKYTSLTDKYASADEKAFAKLIGKKWGVFVNAADNLIALKERGTENKAILEAKNELRESEESLLDTLNGVSAYEEKIINEKKSIAESIVRNTLISTLLVLVVTIIGALGSGLLISSSIVEPITKLRDAADEISRGNMETKIDIKSGDEIEELAASFGKMVEDVRYSKESLEGRARELEESKKALETSVGELEKINKLSIKELKVMELKKKMEEIKSELKKYEG